MKDSKKLMMEIKIKRKTKLLIQSGIHINARFVGQSLKASVNWGDTSGDSILVERAHIKK